MTKCPYNTKGRCRRNQRPYAARGPRRGLLPIAVGEEDEGRRTYGTKSCRAVRPRRGRISDSAAITPVGMLLVYRIYYFTNLPVYPSTSLPASDGHPLRGRSFRCWVARRFVGQALLAYGYSDSPPPGTLQPTRGSGTTDPYDTEG